MAPLRGLPFLLKKGLTCALTPPALDRDRFCSIRSLSCGGSEALVSFSGVDSLDAAEAIAGCYVLVAEDELDLSPLDHSIDDLIGRKVQDFRYGYLGVITEVICTPANDVWTINEGPFGELLIPVIDEVIDSIPDDGPIHTSIMDGIVTESEREDA